MSSAFFALLLASYSQTRRLTPPFRFPWSGHSFPLTLQAHAEFLTSADNCGYLGNSNLEEHGFGENLYLCYGEVGCMMEEGALESVCECVCS